MHEFRISDPSTWTEDHNAVYLMGVGDGELKAEKLRRQLAAVLSGNVPPAVVAQLLSVPLGSDGAQTGRDV